jgi:heme oxygenase
VIDEAEREANRVEDGSHHVKGARRAREAGYREYVRMLEAILFFMRHGQRPGGIADETFAMFRPVCVSLVDKGQCNGGILDLFR